jgi:hypothetical protein
VLKRTLGLGEPERKDAPSGDGAKPA